MLLACRLQLFYLLRRGHLCEWIDTLACKRCCLHLQFHVEHTTKLETAILLEFAGGQLHTTSS